MERLTKIIELHNTLPLSMVDIETKTNEPCVYGYAVDVLAAYEDTGLTPGQVQRIGNILQNIGEEYNCKFEFVAKCLTENSDLIQQLEAEPVRHGTWIEKRKKTLFEGLYEVSYDCSCCGNKVYGKYNYCSNCGAKMDLEESKND